MTRFLTAFSRALDPTNRVEELLASLELDLPEAKPAVGGLILATSACGDDCFEVGRQLAHRWPNATLAGTSFEGVVAGGQIYRDEPAMVLLAWSGTDGPVPTCFVLEPEEAADSARISEAITEAAGRSQLESGDLVLLFADAHGSLAFEETLAQLGPRIAPASLAGAGASGIDGREALSFLDGEEFPGALVGLFIPAASAVGVEEGPVVRCAAATRAASPWLEITKCRTRWIDELEDEPALDWVRRQLGLDSASPIESHLDRLLVRVRGARTMDSQAEEPWEDERYVVGLDARRGSFSWPGRFSAGDQLALALPDRERAREALRGSVGELRASPILLQFACRARDEALHGDSNLESAWAAHCAGDREVIGTVAPFQFATLSDSACRILVHSTVLAALGRV
jgi:small ligand-binding sensory domain FIST